MILNKFVINFTDLSFIFIINKSMREQVWFEKENHQKYVNLLDGILNETDKLLCNHGNAFCVTYNQSKDANVNIDASKGGLGFIALRSANRAFSRFYELFDELPTGPIVPEKSQHTILLKNHHMPNEHIAYTLTTLQTRRGGLSRMMGVGIGNGDVHRIRAFVLTHDERYASITMLRKAEEKQFQSRAEALIDGGIDSLLDALKNGKQLYGYVIPRSFEFIRNSLEINSPGIDVDAFMNKLIDRHYFMQMTRRPGGRVMNHIKTDMTFKQLQDLYDFTQGKTNAITIYEK